MAWIPRLWLVLLALAGPVAADYSAHPAAGALIDELVNKHRFERAAVVELLTKAERQQGIIDAISKPAEKTLTWHRYRQIFLGQDRIREGVQFWRANEAALTRAYALFKVPPEYVVAIIGVETRYGQYRGAWRVLDALTTLTFDYPPRAAFFRSELIQFMLLAREEKKAAEELMGSYAGAMGFGQFISSSYRHYAIDFNGDGGRDIWNSAEDAIGSVANYFGKHGWQGNMPLIADVEQPSVGLLALVSTDPKPASTLADLRKVGYSAFAELADNTPVAVLAFDHEAEAKPAITFRDFYVITRYNHSPLYARAVHELAEAIREAHKVPATETPIRRGSTEG
ncbi:MAG: lytic murein transglycosylase B [Gammaproteobacteria bacterium]|nr:lytic murein transglycosylase B [Gammaproteobacteria bacterium]